MDYNNINNDLFEYEEAFKVEGQTYTTVTYVKILNIVSKDNISISELSIRFIIEIDKYFRGEQFLFVDKLFTSPVPSNLLHFVNLQRSANNLQGYIK